MSTQKTNLSTTVRWRSTQQRGADRKATHYRIFERDPRLDEVCALIDKSGLLAAAISARVTELSGGGAYIAPSTIRRWLRDANQRRAFSFGMDWVERALGRERIAVDDLAERLAAARREERELCARLAEDIGNRAGIKHPFAKRVAKEIRQKSEPP